ncbi:MAG: phosphoesterase [Treponema sp.]|nr:MAG: phosphoesterase [Treponema sp.]
MGISKNSAKFEPIKKDKPLNIAQKNRVIAKILDIIMNNDSFFMLGHSCPDEDCVSSLVALGLLLKKFGKQVCFFLEQPITEQLDFLEKIVEYNDIKMYIGDPDLTCRPDVLFVLDTPKKEMVAAKGRALEFLNDDSIPRIEIDHHFNSDADVSGMPELSLLLRASSTCEILAQICYKLEKRPDILEKYNIDELYSRNIVLAMLTGMIGDAKLGNYLFKQRDKRVFDYFLNKLNKILSEQQKNKSNIASIHEILNILEQLSVGEYNIFSKILSYAKYSDEVGSIVINKANSENIFRENEYEKTVSVVKTATNVIAENAGKVGISVFFDPPEISDKIQFRVRASERANNLNLLSILLDMKIENGGGHPGAIAFRISNSNEKKLNTIMDTIFEKVQKVIQNAKQPKAKL